MLVGVLTVVVGGVVVPIVVVEETVVVAPPEDFGGAAPPATNPNHFMSSLPWIGTVCPTPAAEIPIHRNDVRVD